MTPRILIATSALALTLGFGAVTLADVALDLNSAFPTAFGDTHGSMENGAYWTGDIDQEDARMGDVEAWIETDESEGGPGAIARAVVSDDRCDRAGTNDESR